MVDGKLVHGSALGIPVRGAIIDFNDADAATAINAASGLVKTLFTVGAIALAISAIAGPLSEPSKAISSKDDKEDDKQQNHRSSIASMCRVKTIGTLDCSFNRDFNGVLIEDTIEILVDGNRIPVQSAHIQKIVNPAYMISPMRWLYKNRDMNGKRERNLNMILVDGSRYSNFSSDKEYRFISLSGIQTIKTEDIAEIKGYTPQDLKQFKEKMAYALDNNLDAIVKAVGKDTFDKYFVLK